MRIRVCDSAALAAGKSAVVAHDGVRIAVFRGHDGTPHALEDRCPHRGSPLSEGIVYDGFVACRDHGWSICLRDGSVAAPERGRVRTFTVVERDGVLWVDPDA